MHVFETSQIVTVGLLKHAGCLAIGFTTHEIGYFSSHGMASVSSQRSMPAQQDPKICNLGIIVPEIKGRGGELVAHVRAQLVQLGHYLTPTEPPPVNPKNIHFTIYLLASVSQESGGSARESATCLAVSLPHSAPALLPTDCPAGRPSLSPHAQAFPRAFGTRRPCSVRCSVDSPPFGLAPRPLLACLMRSPLPAGLQAGRVGVSVQIQVTLIVSDVDISESMHRSSQMTLIISNFSKEPMYNIRGGHPQK